VVNNFYICIIKTKEMARRGDIESKTISSRLPMKTYIGLLQTSSSNKKTLSVFVAELIGEFLEKGILTPKIVEVEKIVADPEQAIRIKTLEDKLLKAEQEILEKDKKTKEDIMLRHKLVEVVGVLNKNSHPIGYEIKLLAKQLYPDLNID
jgi:hypothetical protein